MARSRIEHEEYVDLSNKFRRVAGDGNSRFARRYGRQERGRQMPGLGRAQLFLETSEILCKLGVCAGVGEAAKVLASLDPSQETPMDRFFHRLEGWSDRNTAI